MGLWTYYLIVAGVIASVLGLRAWYRLALDRQAARDQAALDACVFGTKFNTPAMGLPHDQQKATAATKVAAQVARRQRKVAASRAVVVPVAQQQAPVVEISTRTRRKA